ncbi:MAG: TetR/AcrR family transcriptional regulator [Caldilineaceae bacterium]
MNWRAVVKEYDERYAEFLDVARLFYTKGYAQTPVQEIIDAIGVAKGTFYHYFDSKGDLLDALIERMLTQQLQSLTPLMQDTTTDAATKFRGSSTTSARGRWQTRRFHRSDAGRHVPR